MKTAEAIIEMKAMGNKLISVTSDTVVHDALRVILENKIHAILVRDGEELVGIWTERDLMENSVTPGFDPKTTRISEVMVTGLQSAPHSANIYMLLDKFLGIHLRHLLIEKDGKYIGLLSVGDVIKAEIREKNHELKELNAMVSWEYYENWGWDK